MNSKIIVLFVLLGVCLSVEAANPSFNDFDTNQFIANPSKIQPKVTIFRLSPTNVDLVFSLNLTAVTNANGQIVLSATGGQGQATNSIDVAKGTNSIIITNGLERVISALTDTNVVYALITAAFGTNIVNQIGVAGSSTITTTTNGTQITVSVANPLNITTLNAGDIYFATLQGYIDSTNIAADGWQGAFLEYDTTGYHSKWTQDGSSLTNIASAPGVVGAVVSSTTISVTTNGNTYTPNVANPLNVTTINAGDIYFTSLQGYLDSTNIAPNGYAGAFLAYSASGYHSAWSEDGSSLTNLTYKYTTNSINTGVFTFGKEYTTNISGNIVLGSFTLGDTAAYESMIIWVTNTGASVFTVTLPSGVQSEGAGRPPVYYSTNGASQDLKIIVEHVGVTRTNSTSQHYW